MDYDGREYGDVLLDIEDGLRAIADMGRAIIQAGVDHSLAYRPARAAKASSQAIA